MFGNQDRSQCSCVNYRNFSFYDNYDGKDERVNNGEQSARPMIVMTLKEGARYTGVSEKELSKLINKDKIKFIKSNCGILVHYVTMVDVKYWWEKYQEGKKK